MPESFESRIAQALTDHGGPPELAPQLEALAESHNVMSCLMPWITFHIGDEWSAGQFNAWCWKYRRTQNEIAARECPDCQAAKRHAYSDGTTPGFFYTECDKHRSPDESS